MLATLYTKTVLVQTYTTYGLIFARSQQPSAMWRYIVSNKNLQHIIDKQDKAINESTNILARLFRTILRDLNIPYSSLVHSIDLYLDKQQLAVKRSTKEQTREKGNLVKELGNNSLTIKNFVKGLQVLNPVSVEFQVSLKWRRGQITVHRVELNMRDGGLETTENKDDDDEN